MQENIILEIRDRGCGIGTERLERLRLNSAETGVGLAGMRELNGKLEIESDGRGTIIRAIVPLFELALPGEPGDAQVLTPPPGAARPLTSHWGQQVQEVWRENRAARNHARSCLD